MRALEYEMKLDEAKNSHLGVYFNSKFPGVFGIFLWSPGMDPPNYSHIDEIEGFYSIVLAQKITSTTRQFNQVFYNDHFNVNVVGFQFL